MVSNEHVSILLPLLAFNPSIGIDAGQPDRVAELKTSQRSFKVMTTTRASALFTVFMRPYKNSLSSKH
jgi:hypothetical protein